MSRTNHIDPHTIEALIDRPEDDVEAQNARAHCAECESCRAAWDQATRTLELLDGSFTFDLTPPTDLVARGLALVSAQKDATVAEARAQEDTRLRWALASACATLAAFALAWLGLGPTELAQPALKCASIELGAAGLVWLATARALYRRGGLSMGTGAASASLGGLSGALYLHLACSDHHTAHLFAAHALTVGVAAVLGALAARSWAPRLRASA